MSLVALPRTYHEAADARRVDPRAVVVAGGTDVMVEVNEGRRRVDRWISLRRVADAAGLDPDGAGLRIGAGTTFETLATHGAMLPALAEAARTVGGPQIRAAATIGGNLATASPAGDALPVLACHDAEIEIARPQGMRRVALDEFLVAPKRTSLAADEVIAAVVLGATGGAQHFAKVGTRNAMVISVCSLAGRLDRAAGVARLAIGSAAPTVRRVAAAEALLLDGAPADEVGQALADAAAPIDDHRASAEYRRHALGVLGRRMTVWLREADHGA